MCYASEKDVFTFLVLALYAIFCHGHDGATSFQPLLFFSYIRKNKNM